MINLSRLEEIKDLRMVWAHEALDFTPWLAEDDNISLLSDAVGIDIVVEATEASVGDFNVDIFATELGTERKIIIENQLEETNHDHLGKLITYASGKEADVIIWVVRRAREEHRAAIEWLNAHTNENIGFFLCEIKLYRIGNSEPAVKFDVIERPNDWVKDIKKANVITEGQQIKNEYWAAFNEYAFQNIDFSKHFNKRKAGVHHFYDLSIGSAACHIGLCIVQKRKVITAEIYISDDKELFARLYDRRQEIESAAGIEFDWRELPERKASRIVIEKNCESLEKYYWNEQFEWFMDVATKMKKTFKKYI